MPLFPVLKYLKVTKSEKTGSRDRNFLHTGFPATSNNWTSATRHSPPAPNLGGKTTRTYEHAHSMQPTSQQNKRPMNVERSNHVWPGVMRMQARNTGRCFESQWRVDRGFVAVCHGASCTIYRLFTGPNDQSPFSIHKENLDRVLRHLFYP